MFVFSSQFDSVLLFLSIKLFNWSWTNGKGFVISSDSCSTAADDNNDDIDGDDIKKTIPFQQFKQLNLQ